MRIGIRTGRLNIFLFVFSITSIKGRYYEAVSIDFISEAYLFIMFYFLIQRYSETIPLGKS
jgi:hypothetical protein